MEEKENGREENENGREEKDNGMEEKRRRMEGKRTTVEWNGMEGKGSQHATAARGRLSKDKTTFINSAMTKKLPLPKIHL